MQIARSHNADVPGVGVWESSHDGVHAADSQIRQLQRATPPNRRARIYRLNQYSFLNPNSGTSIQTLVLGRFVATYSFMVKGLTCGTLLSSSALSSSTIGKESQRCFRRRSWAGHIRMCRCISSSGTVVPHAQVARNEECIRRTCLRRLSSDEKHFVHTEH